MADDDQNLEVEAVEKEPVVPEWVPEKFRSNPEKFGEAYVNLEREFHRSREEQKALQTQLEELIAAQQEPAQPATSNEALYQAYENDPLQVTQWIAEQTAQKILQASQQEQQKLTQPYVDQQNQLLAFTADQMVAQKVPDWGDYKERVSDAIREDPDLLPETALASPERVARALERVYKQVKHDDLLNQTKTLTEQQADLQRQAKMAAQTLTGPSGRPAPTDADREWFEGVKNAPTRSYSELARQGL